MKKYFLIATLACMGLPLLFSCSNPSGTPKKDAELLKGLAENTIETRIKQMEQLLEFAQYYADQGDYKGYEKFKKKRGETALPQHCHLCKHHSRK